MKDIWFQTFTGKRFDLLDPKPESICIEDIAHHLALNNRYNGATSVPYSVAQHSVMVSDMLAKLEFNVVTRMAALLHDAHEAYIGDIIGPLKKCLRVQFEQRSEAFAGRTFVEHGFQKIGELEDRIDVVIREALGLTDVLKIDDHVQRVIKKADKVALVTEVRDLMAVPPDLWEEHQMPNLPEPWPMTITALEWRDAEALFLRRYEALRSELGL